MHGPIRLICLLCFSVLASLIANSSSHAETNAMVHPNRIMIPKDIPFVIYTETITKTKKSKKRILAAIDYQRGHYLGWQDALSGITSSGYNKARTKAYKTTALMRQSCSTYFSRGTEEGYDACLLNYSKLLKRGGNEKQLQKESSEAYAPLSEAPPPLKKTKS